MINKKREEKALKEQEEAKRKEKERIEMGRNMAKFKSWKVTTNFECFNISKCRNWMKTAIPERKS